MVDPPRRIAAAVTGIGLALCVIGWYQIAGQPTVPQQLPYLASATIPGAALLGTGLVLLLRGPLTRTAPRAGTPGAREPRAAETPRSGLWRVPDGRYLHSADCPLLDGRTDLLPAQPEPAVGGAPPPSAPAPSTSPPSAPPSSSSELRSCPLCRAGDAADRA